MAASPEELALAVATLTAGVAAVHAAGRLGRRAGQPPVVGELLGGLVLGAMLGALGGPGEAAPVVEWPATVGLVVFLFTMGLEVDRTLLRRHLRGALSVSVLGIVVPFVSGVALGVALAAAHATGPKAAFALFVGTAMAITAFPVLARLLEDQGLTGTALGTLVLAAAALDDLVAWGLLLVVVVIATSGSAADLLATAATLVGLGCVLVLVVRPVLRRLAGRPAPVVLLVAGVGLAASAATTAAAGVHEAIGAFAFGLVFPRGDDAEVLTRVAAPVARRLLPLVFVVAGLALDLDLLGGGGVLELAAVLVVAFSGKLAGGYAGARWHGVRPREAAAVAVLMNTRGLAELVVVTVGLELGVLDVGLYGILVVMALVTTMVASPVVRRLDPDPSLGAGTPPRVP